MHLILRQTIHEAFWQRQLNEIIELCHKAKIQEVMLMEQSHQIVMVPFPLEKHHRMAKIYTVFAKKLREKGIEFSVNIATIIGHSDAPVPNDQKLPFTRFVGEDKKQSDAVYCMSDENWVDYACEVVKIYAQTHPKRLMIDDDFRSLNHTSQFGCFCETHAHLVSEACQMDELHTRGLIDALLGYHPDEMKIKKAWQVINFKLQVNAAHRIEEAIHSVDSKIQVGLMNSGEPAHSLQGRNMNVLLEAFAKSGQQALSRPAGGVYADGLHTQVVNMHQMPALSKASVTYPTMWVSEIENWPHSRYIKSIAITKLQMMMHALWGADALTLNLYDYLASPLAIESGWEKLLIDIQPTLDKIQQLRQDKKLLGVTLPWKLNEASFLKNEHHRFDDLLPNRSLDTLLPLLGIPVQFEMGNTVILCGDQVESYTDDELRSFFTHSIFLDDKAALHCIRRGFQSEIGVIFHEKIEIPTVERLTNPDFSKQFLQCDLPTNWFRLEIQGDTMHRIELMPGAIALSYFVDDQQNQQSPALSLFSNTLGGKVAVLAQRVQDLSWLHRGRSEQLQNLFSFLDPSLKPYMISDSPNIAPFVYQNAKTKEILFAAVNTGLDIERIGMPHPNATLIIGSIDQSKIVLKPLEMILMTWKVVI